MRSAWLVLGGWMAVAPVLTACACPPQPRSEGASRCCCPEEKPSTPCSRAASYVDDLGAPDAGPAPAAPVTAPFAPDLPLVVAASPNFRAPDEGPLRGFPDRPRHLLNSVLLL